MAFNGLKIKNRKFLPAFRVAAAALLIHAALLRVGAVVAAIVARRRPRALAARMLALIRALCSLLHAHTPSRNAKVGTLNDELKATVFGSTFSVSCSSFTLTSRRAACTRRVD